MLAESSEVGTGHVAAYARPFANGLHREIAARRSIHSKNDAMSILTGEEELDSQITAHGAHAHECPLDFDEEPAQLFTKEHLLSTSAFHADMMDRESSKIAE